MDLADINSLTLRNEINWPFFIGNAVVIQNGTFAWSPTLNILKGINLRVKEGSLVAVVGTVGKLEIK